MSYKKNIMSNFVTQISVSILAFLTSIVVARTLGPADKGYVGYIVLIFTMIAEYGNLGIIKASIYFQKRSKYDEEHIFRNNQTLIMMNFVFITALVLILRASGIILVGYSYFYILMGLGIVFFSFANLNMNSFYIGNERIIEINKFNLVMSIGRSITVVLLWIGSKLTMESYLITYVTVLGVLSLLLYRNLNINMKWTLDIKLAWKQFKFGWAIYAATLFIYLNYKMDQIFIRNILGEADMGVYSVAVSLAELLFLIPGSSGTAIIGRLYNIDFKNIKERKYITSMTVKYTFYICLVIGIIGMMMTPLIPIVYGVSYSGASTPTLILFVGVIFASIGKVSYSYFQSKGNTSCHLIITFATFVLNLILNYILIWRYGIVGAAIASSISYFVYGILYIVAFIKFDDFTLSDFFKIKIEGGRLR